MSNNYIFYRQYVQKCFHLGDTFTKMSPQVRWAFSVLKMIFPILDNKI